MDALPSKDQGIVPAQTSPEPAEGIAETLAHPEWPRFMVKEDAPIHRTSDGIPVLAIVAIILGFLGSGWILCAVLFVLLAALGIASNNSAPAPAVVPAKKQPVAPVAKPLPKVDEGRVEPPAPPDKAEKDKDGAPRKDKQP